MNGIVKVIKQFEVTKPTFISGTEGKLKVSVKNMNPTFQLQLEEFDSELAVSFLLQAVGTPIKRFFM